MIQQQQMNGKIKSTAVITSNQKSFLIKNNQNFLS